MISIMRCMYPPPYLNTQNERRHTLDILEWICLVDLLDKVISKPPQIRVCSGRHLEHLCL